MNATPNAAEMTAARNEYRALRAQSKMAAKDFDYRALFLAHELADGECVRPFHWVRAAKEILAS